MNRPRRFASRHRTRTLPQRMKADLHKAAASILVAAIASTCLVACGKPLLSAKDERSQYDRYDRVRNEYAAQFVEDEFGRRIPNLKARLSPK